MYTTELFSASATAVPNCDHSIGASAFASYEQLLENICPNEIFNLQKELGSLLSAIDAAERMYAIGDSDYQEVCVRALERAATVKASVRTLAIALGVHREFLAEYADLAKRTA